MCSLANEVVIVACVSGADVVPSVRLTTRKDAPEMSTSTDWNTPDTVKSYVSVSPEPSVHAASVNGTVTEIVPSRSSGSFSVHPAGSFGTTAYQSAKQPAIESVPCEQTHVACELSGGAW